jgi:hypothetical protein
MPQLNLALGPMTAGIKGFNLRIDDLRIDPETLEASAVSAGLLAAVDDPRGVFALSAMFNPALAGLELPPDGSFVQLPGDPDLGTAMPPLRVAVLDRALLLVAGDASEGFAAGLRDAQTITPPPLVGVDYGVRELVERLGPTLDAVARQLHGQGEVQAAAEIREQLDGLRLQAGLFERSRVLVYATEAGLVMDQVMELR